MITTKVAKDAMEFAKKIKRLQRVKANPMRVKLETPVRTMPSIIAHLEKNDYTVWARQLAAILKGTFVPPTMSSWTRYREQLAAATKFVNPIWHQTDSRLTEESIEYPQTISTKNAKGEWTTKLAPWSPTYIDDFGRKLPAVEITQRISTQPVNVDVPDDLYLYEMGCGNRKNESLDYRSMDDRDFRERCIGVGNKVYALYEKRKPDLNPRSDLRQEVMSLMLNPDVDYCDVDTLTHVFRDMRLSRRAVLKLIHGYVRPDENGKMIKTSGMKALDRDGLDDLAYDFEQMSDDLKEFDIPDPETNKPRTLEDERAYWLDVAQRKWDNGARSTDDDVALLDQMEFIESSARRDFENGYYEDPDHVDRFTIYRDDEVLFDRYADLNEDDIDSMIEWDPTDEQTAMAIDANAFSAHPLYDESSCVSDEFIDEIKSASWMDLSEIKQYLMGGDTWFLNSDQRKIAWSFIKGREDRLIADAMKRPIAKLVGSYITESKDSGRACAMLFAWKNEERFDTDDTIFKFDEEGSLEEELVAAWTIFRREHKDHQKKRKVKKERNRYMQFAYRDRKPGEKGGKRIAVKREVDLKIADITGETAA